MTRSVYLILGMHRSGTSALSRVVAGTGAALPKTPMPADRYNARGYFESSRIALLNTQRLHAHGSAWDDVFSFPAPQLPEALERQWQAQAAALMAEEFGAADACLLKDPRITLLLPAWRGVFSKTGQTPRCVVALRDPLAVAASLARRDLFNAHKSVLLWTTYMLAAAAYTRELPTVCVAYDALLADWRSQLARIEAVHGLPAAGLELGLNGDAGIDEFLSADLSHHNSPSGDLAELGWIGQMAADVHAWWLAAAADQDPDHAQLREVAEQLDRRRRDIGLLVTPISHQLDLARNRIAALAQEFAARSSAKPSSE